MGFNINNYTEVKDRLIAFNEEYPNATIETELLQINNIVDSPSGEMCNEYVIKAKVIPNPIQEPEVYFTGLAAERDNTGFVNKTSALENGETSAVGRALAFAGFGGDFAIASKEEVENAQAAQKKSNVTIAMTKELDELVKEMEKEGSLDAKSTARYSLRREEGYFDTKAKWTTTKNSLELSRKRWLKENKEAKVDKRKTKVSK